MRTALLLALAVLATTGAWSRESVPTSAFMRRHELRYFYCTAQLERARHEVARGRWVENRRCW